MHDLAATYRGQGRWDEAESLLSHAVQRMQHMMGYQHPTTVSYMQHLENILEEKQQGPEQVCSFIPMLYPISYLNRSLMR